MIHLMKCQVDKNKDLNKWVLTLKKLKPSKNNPIISQQNKNNGNMINSSILHTNKEQTINILRQQIKIKTKNGPLSSLLHKITLKFTKS